MNNEQEIIEMLKKDLKEFYQIKQARKNLHITILTILIFLFIISVILWVILPNLWIVKFIIMLLIVIEIIRPLFYKY